MNRALLAAAMDVRQNLHPSHQADTALIAQCLLDFDALALHGAPALLAELRSRPQPEALAEICAALRAGPRPGSPAAHELLESPCAAPEEVP